jgi:ABC-2 type transport system ATP-binding protein
MSEIKSRYAKRNISLNYEGNISFLQHHPMIEKISDFGNSTGIKITNSANSQDLLKLLIDNNVIIKRFDANDISLHEIFVELAGSDEEVSNV